MDIGWKKINDYWYHFNSSGVMNTGTLKENTRTYYFNSSSGILYCTELGVKEEKQEGKNLCWAACAVMVGTYNTNSTVTQKSVVGATHFNSNLDKPEIDEVAVKGMEFASKNTKSGKIVSPLLFNEAVAQIDKNHPFMMHITWLNGSGGHMLVCAGYKKENNNEYVRIIDPDPPDPKIAVLYYKYENLCNTNLQYNVPGTCTSMIIY